MWPPYFWHNPSQLKKIYNTWINRIHFGTEQALQCRCFIWAFLDAHCQSNVHLLEWNFEEKNGGRKLQWAYLGVKILPKQMLIANTMCISRSEILRKKRNKNTKCPIDVHCHHLCRRDPRITKLHWSSARFELLSFLQIWQEVSQKAENFWLKSKKPQKLKTCWTSISLNLFCNGDGNEHL